MGSWFSGWFDLQNRLGCFQEKQRRWWSPKWNVLEENIPKGGLGHQWAVRSIKIPGFSFLIRIRRSFYWIQHNVSPIQLSQMLCQAPSYRSPHFNLGHNSLGAHLTDKEPEVWSYITSQRSQGHEGFSLSFKSRSPSSESSVPQLFLQLSISMTFDWGRRVGKHLGNAINFPLKNAPDSAITTNTEETVRTCREHETGSPEAAAALPGWSFCLCHSQKPATWQGTIEKGPSREADKLWLTLFQGYCMPLLWEEGGNILWGVFLDGAKPVGYALWLLPHVPSKTWSLRPSSSSVLVPTAAFHPRLRSCGETQHVQDDRQWPQPPGRWASGVHRGHVTHPPADTSTSTSSSPNKS